ncbi:MAG: hypothetical protein JJ895_14335 [Balneolaceae bacterium]|nr:hypothetical protein [Balneolaceae bacterium]
MQSVPRNNYDTEALQWNKKLAFLVIVFVGEDDEKSLLYPPNNSHDDTKIV